MSRHRTIAAVALLVVAQSLLWGGVDRANGATRRSPSGPPLVSGSSAYAAPESSAAGAGGRERGESGEAEGEAADGASEPLVENGLGSPLCNESGVELAPSTQSDCRTSGFVASAAPTQNYGFDVNIDSGPEDSVAAYFQDFLIKPPWAVLVWAVHALLVGVEWSYTLDLLSSPTMKQVAQALSTLQRTFTHPLLTLALAIGAVVLAWRGIVRRESAASLGEALTILAMIAAGLFMVLDPLGTVGRLAGWSDSASIATLGTVVSGAPASPDRTLATSTTQLFETTVVGPWCFMEFGNVAWCEEPRQLDPVLRQAATKLATRDEAEAAKSSAQRAAGLTDIAVLLRSAQTNGATFLAQPADGPARNSSKGADSLLHAICNGPSATRCTGSTASEAEFRTSSFTIDRLVGLIMIWCGALGLLLLLGYVLARLIGAAVLSLLFLLVAPAAVLLPALGERGRTAFRDWLSRLFGAVVAKLIWSFLLGALLASMKVLLLLGGFGWWVQWLLMSVLWWGAFHHRNRLLAISGPVGGGTGHGARRARAALWRSRSTVGRARRHLREREERGDRRSALAQTAKAEPFEPRRLPGPSRGTQSAAPTPSPVPAPAAVTTVSDAERQATEERRAAVLAARQRQRDENAAYLVAAGALLRYVPSETPDAEPPEGATTA